MSRTEKSANGMMRRAIMAAPGEIEFEELEIPEPGSDQALIKVHSCALCTWEQRMYTGDEPIYPMAGGHEVSGIVEKVGERVFNVQPGDHVTLSGLYRCHQCESCLRGYENICENMYKVRNPPGGLGEYVLRYGADCFKIADDVPFEHASLSEPLACVLRSVKQSKLQGGERVVIVGAGLMGLLHLVLAKNLGAVVFVSEPDESRQQKALEMGADLAFNPLEEDYVEKVKALTNGRGADVTYVCVAHPSTVEPAVAASANAGRVLLYSSFFPKGQKIEVDPNIFHKKEVVLTGTMSQTRGEFLEAAQLISNRTVDLEPLISATYPLDQVKEAFDEALKINTYRVVVQP